MQPLTKKEMPWWRIHPVPNQGSPKRRTAVRNRARENTMTIAKLDPLPARDKRRTFLSGFTLSATAIALLAGNEKLGLVGSASAQTADNDVTILNSALGAEQQAIAAYQLGAESGLLQKAVKDLAVQFQGHHKAHADALAEAVTKLGGKPVAPMKDYHFPKEKLKSQNDVLTFAATLEKGAVSAYLGAVPILTDKDLAKAAASILGDEAMHWAVLRHALGQNPVPEAFVS
jgi:rubrerythrin